LLKDEKNSLEKMKFSKFFKEISCFIGIVVSQIRTFRTSILKKNSNSFDSEIFFTKIQKNEHSFSNFKFNSKTNNSKINYENPIFEKYEKMLEAIEDDLIKLTVSKKESDNISELDSCFSIRNADSIAVMEKYFFKLLENSVVSFSKEDFTLAIEPLELSSDAFCKVLEECTIENSSFVFEEKKGDTQMVNNDNALFFSFLGNEMKNNIKKKAIYIEKSEKNQEEGNFIYFTKFYLDIMKMLGECERRMNQYK